MKLKKREVPTQQGSALFLKFKDGETKVGIFRGEVHEFYQIWEGGKSTVVSPDHPNAKVRFRANFITREEGELRPKIFDFGLTVYNQLAELGEEYDLEKTAIRITRRGMGTDTIYLTMPAKEQPTLTQIKSLEAVELNVLEHPTALTKPEGGGEQTASEELPF